MHAEISAFTFHPDAHETDSRPGGNHSRKSLNCSLFYLFIVPVLSSNLTELNVARSVSFSGNI